MIYYTGIGARKTPEVILIIFQSFANWFSTNGYILRSGGALGADYAFEIGCDHAAGRKEIFLPWQGYNNSKSELYYIPSEAFEIAADIYGSTWNYLKPSVKNLMARNMLQIMGIGLDEASAFVICWTPDGCSTHKSRTKQTGGTGQAIAYADEMGIPVFNIQDKKQMAAVCDFVDNIELEKNDETK